MIVAERLHFAVTRLPSPGRSDEKSMSPQLVRCDLRLVVGGAQRVALPAATPSTTDALNQWVKHCHRPVMLARVIDFCHSTDHIR